MDLFSITLNQQELYLNGQQIIILSGLPDCRNNIRAVFDLERVLYFILCFLKIFAVGKQGLLPGGFTVFAETSVFRISLSLHLLLFTKLITSFLQP